MYILVVVICLVLTRLSRHLISMIAESSSYGDDDYNTSLKTIIILITVLSLIPVLNVLVAFVLIIMAIISGLLISGIGQKVTTFLVIILSGKGRDEDE